MEAIFSIAAGFDWKGLKTSANRFWYWVHRLDSGLG
jgi:hypothetical protein